MQVTMSKALVRVCSHPFYVSFMPSRLDEANIIAVSRLRAHSRVGTAVIEL